MENEEEEDMMIFLRRRNGIANAVDLEVAPPSVTATFEVMHDGVAITGKTHRRIEVHMKYNRETDEIDGETGYAFDACRKYVQPVPGFLSEFIRAMPEQSKKAFGHLAMMYKIDTDSPGHVLLIIRCIREGYPELVSAYKRALSSTCSDTFLDVHASVCKSLGCSHVGPGIPKWGFGRQTELQVLADMILHLYCNGAFGCCPADLQESDHKKLVNALKEWQVPRFIRESGLAHNMWNAAMSDKRSETFYEFRNKIGKY